MDWAPVAAVLVGLGALGGLGTGVAALVAASRDRKTRASEVALHEATAAQMLTQAAETLITPLSKRIEKQEERIRNLETELARKEAEIGHRDKEIAALREELTDARKRLASLETEVLRLGGDPREVHP